jgi:hypothetical protein
MPAHKKHRLCEVPGCDAKHVANGLCRKHYGRNWRTGSLESTRRDPGSGTITMYGYITHGNQKKQEHITIAERALGKPLPPRAEVHHINEIKHDNRPENLVICPSRAYHFLLHQRMRALDACGHADWRKCPFCKAYDAPDNMKVSKHGRHMYHNDCKQQYRKARDLIKGESNDRSCST